MVGLIVSNWNELSLITGRYGGTDIITSSGTYYRSIFIGNREIIATQSGIGIKNARKAAHDLINKYKPGLIINAGIAGALHPGIGVGNVVVGDWVYSLKKNLKIGLHCSSNIKTDNINNGGILTSNKFIDHSKTKKCLFEKTAAIVVDMETWGIAEDCERNGKALSALKSVSDKSSDDLPSFGYIMDKNSRLKYGIAAGYFARHPHLFYKYLQFRYINMPRAANNLNNFIVRFVNQCNYE